MTKNVLREQFDSERGMKNTRHDVKVVTCSAILFIDVQMAGKGVVIFFF